jgi:hypothetical protein
MINSARVLTALITGMLHLPISLRAQDKQVMIQVIQDDASSLTDFQTSLVLERRPFKFQILLRNVEGVYVFASIRDSVYRFTETSVIRDFPYLELLKLREEDVFNTHRELSISETGWSYWYYKPDPEPHAFNRKVVRLDSGRIICTKQIRNLYSVNEGRVIRLRELRTPLYLFFVAVSGYDESGRPRLELLRRKVKIEWVDAD